MARVLTAPTGGRVLTPPTTPPADNRNFIDKAAAAIKSSPLGFVAPLGEGLGNSAFGIWQSIAQRSLQPALDAGAENFRNVPKMVGSAVASAALPASIGLAAPASLGAAAAQYGGLGAAQAASEGLAAGKSLPEIATDAGTAGLIGGALGGTFNLIGRGISAAASKAAPSALSFTSGVPKEAISQAAENPQAAKEGLSLSVREVRDKATGSLQTLYNDLGREFDQGLKTVVAASGQTKKGMTYTDAGFLKSAADMRDRLTEYSRTFAREFRLGTKATPEGVVINFDQSPITKPGEMQAVQKAFQTISTWDDFSAKGMQDLAERLSSLRNFEHGAKTQSSAIVSKIYNKVTGAGGEASHALIPKYYPQLAELRTNYAVNREVLDEISSVLSFNKDDPKAIQGAVSRLDNIFKENKDTYLNIVRELGKRSGVDYLSLLAGGEFQKVLPGFIRGLGGAGVVGVGAAVLNPYLLLLAPLFSPRAVGTIVRNAPAAAETTSQLTRATTVQALNE